MSFENKFEYVGFITEISDKNFILKSKSIYVKIYSDNLENFRVGDRIKVVLDGFKTNEKNIEHTFSYSRYLYSKLIVKEGNLNSFEILDNNFNLFKIKGYIIDYIDEKFLDQTSIYIKRLILGISNFDDSLDASINNLGIIFLFCISGLHISILSSIIKKILSLLNVEEEIISLILSIILFVYMIILNSSSSVFRAVFIVLLNELSKTLRLRLSKLDTLFISFFISLLLNPFSIFNLGFYLTYLSTLVIYLNENKSSINLSTILIVFSMPLIIYQKGSVSILIVLSSLIFNIIFSNLIIPLSYLTLFIYPLGLIYEEIVTILNKLIMFFDFNGNVIDISIPNIYSLIIIYALLFVTFSFYKERKAFFKRLISTFIIELILVLSSLVSFVTNIVFFDVGQGDSFLIRSGKYNILVDTGEKDNYDTIFNYLKSQNIKVIDECFISHKDSDHYSEYERLKDLVIIKNTHYDENDTIYKINDITIYTLCKKFDDINDSSMVLYLTIKNKKILLTGDIEKKGEENLFNKTIKDIDVLKVAHHGSNSSSNSELIKKLNPKISIISVGLNNRYGHPNKETLEILKEVDSTIYRTDEDGSITIYFFYNFMFIKTYKKDNLTLYKNLCSYRIHT